MEQNQYTALTAAAKRPAYVIFKELAEVLKLYDYRDHYFEKFDITRAKFKTEDVEKQLEETLKSLEQLHGNVL
ncbi:hypothetical protein LSH36_454g04027 [Paralvinella palmiformis]|uniref:Uncharacterized protein n=1 Tax=Paralvinella palmiformis TaxID=53620 RepID=A0AAD9JA31_9ANNE|nr:hypothetical protein LSH36_454g04027 [Paralvinella palmiformis]